MWLDAKLSRRHHEARARSDATIDVHDVIAADSCAQLTHPHQHHLETMITYFRAFVLQNIIL